MKHLCGTTNDLWIKLHVMFPPIELISVQTLFVVERQIKKEKKRKEKKNYV